MMGGHGSGWMGKWWLYIKPYFCIHALNYQKYKEMQSK